MLYDVVVHLKLPGNNPEDAKKRLAVALPHWPHTLVEITPAAEQPPKLVGTLNIQLPSTGVSNGR